MADALPVTIITPAAAATNPPLSYTGRIHFRSRPQAELETYPLDVGRPAFATDTYVLMIGSDAGNVVFTPYDPAPLIQRVTALEALAQSQASLIQSQATFIQNQSALIQSLTDQLNAVSVQVNAVSTQLASMPEQMQSVNSQMQSVNSQLSTLGEKVMSYIPATPIVPVAVPETGTATLTRPASATTYEVDTTGGAVTLTLYAATGSNLPITIDNTKGTANVTVTASGTDTFDTPMPVIVPGASNTLRDYASGKWVVN